MQKGYLFEPPLPRDCGKPVQWQNLHGASRGLAIVNAIKEANKPILIVAKDALEVAHILEELTFFSGNNLEIHHFPDWETLPYDHFSPHQDIISDRLSTLYRMPGLTKGVIITTITTLMHRLCPENYLDGNTFLLKIGDQLNLDVLRTRLAHGGYRHTNQVREHGEFAIRGSLIDLFPMGTKNPFRIDLFDNEVDSIRAFAADTQRTLEKIEEIRLLPAKEFPLTEDAIEYFRQQWRSTFSGNPLKSPVYQDVSEGICTAGIEYYLPLFFEKTASLFDYLPKNTIVFKMGPLETKANEYWQEIQLRYEQGCHDVSRPLLKPEKLFLSVKEIEDQWQNYALVQIGNNQSQNSFRFETVSAPTLDINHKATEPLAALQNFLRNDTGRVLFCAETLGRREVILQLFRTISLYPKFFNGWHEYLTSQDQYGIVVTPLEEGFGFKTDPQQSITVLPETGLYGKRIMQRRLRKTTQYDADAFIRDLSELQIGDPVVHIDHGIGKYLGLKTLTVNEQAGEFLTLEYQDEAKLYVPVASLQLISRYSGASPEHIAINRLGTEQWQKAKRRASEKIRDVAAELLDLYAKRASRPGFTYDLVKDQYAAFAAAFPFEETPDQLRAIEQVFADMTSTKPMDRVICGDVGFGKTEVALRATFLAVLNGKQVALMVPTTLLAQQHYENFRNRFADWPIQVEVLSRFRTPKEQKNVLERMHEGKVDVVIGTHKLLQDDILFKNLGLVIIDEEHRFGVKQKEKLKVLRSHVDFLTLTATPIPRTLNMTLSGIRDLSVIATPPLRRLSVKTFLYEYKNHIIEEAIQREIMRGGQVFFLHNDVATINKKAEDLKTLVPEARVVVAHGQMPEHTLERVMSDFYHRKYNVLVCSTIIESGIDIPTANTIIINRADKFGLAQLHQLRGRVGRSHHQAYAYLIAPSKDQLTNDAIKRLDAITSLDDLGIGFTLSTHDLEIRGAGEILGEEQSGNMHEIGFTLYMDLLSRAVDALKDGKELDLEKSLLHHRSEVDLKLPALIPETYLNDVQLRLEFYKRIANTKTQNELDQIQIEMIDRFGLLPQPLKNLIAITELKHKADSLGIIKIEASDKGGKLEFNEKPNIKPENIIRMIQHPSKLFRLEGPTRLRFILEPHVKEDRVKLIGDILIALTK